MSPNPEWAESIAAVVANAPPLTEAQLIRLAQIFRIAERRES